MPFGVRGNAVPVCIFASEITTAMILDLNEKVQ
jgi:hypothetical protein